MWLYANEMAHSFNKGLTLHSQCGSIKSEGLNCVLVQFAEAKVGG